LALSYTKTMSYILVTGVNGFVGHHVASLLHERSIRVIGVGREPKPQTDLAGVLDSYVSCDLTDRGQVASIDLSAVDAIINLAGFAKVGESRGQGELYNRINVGVHTTLYQECINQGVSPRIIAVSTGAVYDPNQELPITEESDLVSRDRTNEYTISKQKMEEAVTAFNDRGLQCIIVRPFNHSGPGQLPGFLLPDLGEQIEEAAQQGVPLMVGNLATKRDYTDVRDVARAYVELATVGAERLNHTIYNICSGVSTKGTTILDLLKESFGASDVEVKVDQSRIRPHDVMDIYGSRDRLTQDTGWQPEISVEQMVQDYANWKKSTT
jgi:GDP-4-dehydro-6-deoxy-D-mannose reductase